MKDIGAALKNQNDRRQADDGLGAHDVEFGRAFERLLQWNCDQLFHFGGRHALPFGLNFHAWRREFGKDVDRACRAAALMPNGNHHRRGEHDKEAKL